MTEDEFIQALVDAKTPKDVQSTLSQYADAADLARRADQLERMRQARELTTPMDSSSFFQRLLQQGGAKPIPLQ